MKSMSIENPVREEKGQMTGVFFGKRETENGIF